MQKLEQGKRVAGRWHVITELFSEDIPRYRVAGVEGAVAELLLIDSVDSLREHLAAAIDLQHENIVGSYEAGVWVDQPYYVRELLAMEPLPDWHGRHLNPDEDQVAAIGCQLALVLKQAEAAGIKRCGFSPLTVNITGDGYVKIDLLERFFRDIANDDYQSPEEMAGEEGDLRSDIYRLGALLANLMLGEKFGFDNEKIHAFLRSDEESEAISRRFHEILRTMISPTPRDRYLDGDTVLRELHTVLEGQPPVPGQERIHHAAEPVERATQEKTSSWHEDKRFWLYVAGAFGILMILMLIIQAFRS